MNPFRDTDTLLFAIALFILGTMYAAVTPPLRVPDEEAHFLRGVALAHGDPQPRIMGWRPFSPLPMGIRDFALAIYKPDVFAKYTVADLRRAAGIPLHRESLASVHVPAWYSPVPYVAQGIAALGGRLASMRPIVTFYLGRISNLLLAVAVISAAIALLPRRSLLVAVPVLLPMTLYQFASWSPDALTISASFLFTALLLRAMQREEVLERREAAELGTCALILGLCKPVYFLTALAAIAIPGRRFRSNRHRLSVAGGIMLAMALGTTLAALAASRSYYRPRPELPIDPAQQLTCIEKNPFRYFATTANDFLANGPSYGEQMIGRLGLMNIKIPFLLRVVFGGLLIAAAVTAPPLPLSARLLLLVIVGGTIFGVSLSQYLVWTTLCSEGVEGIQGRYFLPVLPMALAALGIPRLRFRPSMFAILATGVIANSVALVVLIREFWTR